MAQDTDLRPVRSRARLLVLPAAACLMLVGAAAPAAASDGYFANLRGSVEVPGPGDPDGAGAAVVSFYPRLGRVCAAISVARLGDPVAAHIHAGRRGVAGPVVIDLTTAVQGGARCVNGVDEHLIRVIRNHPSRYYVNVHTADYPDGAVRGQLQG